MSDKIFANELKKYSSRSAEAQWIKYGRGANISSIAIYAGLELLSMPVGKKYKWSLSELKEQFPPADWPAAKEDTLTKREVVQKGKQVANDLIEDQAELKSGYDQVSKMLRPSKPRAIKNLPKHQKKQIQDLIQTAGKDLSHLDTTEEASFKHINRRAEEIAKETMKGTKISLGDFLAKKENWDDEISNIAAMIVSEIKKHYGKK